MPFWLHPSLCASDPSASAPSRAEHPAPPPRSLPLLLMGVTTRGRRRVSPARSLFPPPTIQWERRGGAPRGPRLLRTRSDSAASTLPGVGVAASSRSQESLVLADPSPVDSSVSAGGDRRSPSPKIGGTTGDRFRSRSSCLSPLRDQDSHEEHCCARSLSRGSCDQSRKSRSRFMDHLWSLSP